MKRFALRAALGLGLLAASCGPRIEPEPRSPGELVTPEPFYPGGSDAPPTASPPAEMPITRPPEIRTDAGAMVLHFIDVGQGAATLIELPCAAMLVDTGGEVSTDYEFDSTRELLDYLDRFFERRADLARTIELLVLTHPHIDHVRGVPAVVERYTVRNVVANGQPGSYPAEEEMKALAAFVAGGVPSRAVALADIRSTDGLTDSVIDPIACADIDPRIRVLWGRLDRSPGWPKDRWGKDPWKNANNHSVATRIDFGAASVLITGDLQEHAIGDLLKKYEGTRTLDVDLYAVGHHGSYNATTKELVTAMAPKIAVIAAGAPDRETKWTAWDHGHPRDVVVRLLVAGVSLTRPRVEVPVFAAQESPPESWTIDKAIYSVGWSGDVVIAADASGSWRVVAPSSGRGVSLLR